MYVLYTYYRKWRLHLFAMYITFDFIISLMLVSLVLFLHTPDDEELVLDTWVVYFIYYYDCDDFVFCY